MAVTVRWLVPTQSCLGEAQNAGCQGEGVVGAWARSARGILHSRLQLSLLTCGNKPMYTLAEMTSVP